MDNKAMNKLSYGLYVLSSKDEKDNACISNTVIQLTSSPNRISVALNKQNYTHDMIQKSGVFNVSVLDQTTPFELIQNFGFQSGRTVDKFQNIPFERSANGLVYIPDNTNAYLSAKVFSTVDLGTHTLFLADLLDAEVLSDKESLTYSYYFQHIKKSASTTKKGYRCKICGYIYEGEPLPPDFICPVCKHGAVDFEKII